MEITRCPICLGGATKDNDNAVPPDGIAIRCAACSPPAVGYFWVSRDFLLGWERAEPTLEARKQASNWIRGLPAGPGKPPKITSEQLLRFGIY